MKGLAVHPAPRSGRNLACRNRPGSRRAITRSRRAARVGAGTFREPINILSRDFACGNPDLVITCPLRTGGVSTMEFAAKRRVLLERHLRPRGAFIYPNTVYRSARVPGCSCIFPVINRKSMTAPPLPSRGSDHPSSRRSIPSGLHFAVHPSIRHNIGLPHLPDSLSAGAPAAYHRLLCRVVSGRRAATRLRTTRPRGAYARPHSPTSLGSRN